MKDTDFLKSSSFIRVHEKRLLTGSALDRVVDATDTREALRMLSQNSDYDFTALGRVEDFEELLKGELQRVYRMAAEQSREFPELVEIPGCKYDYHNGKVALKAKHLTVRVDTPYIQVTGISPNLIRQYVEKPDPKSDLPDHLKTALNLAEGAFEKSGNPQDIDTVLDRAMYARMLELCGELQNPFLTGYVKLAIDAYNVKTFLRVKNMQKGSAFLADCLAEGGDTDPGLFLAHYGKSAATLAPVFQYKGYGGAVKAGLEHFEKSGSYAELERLLDNRLMNCIRDAKFIAFGPEVLFCYILAKENEIRQIRIVVACKNNGIPAETLKERLRENYA